MNKNLIIGGGIALAVAAAIIYSIYQTATVPPSQGPATTTGQSTSTPNDPAPQAGGPTIPTTPFTVYLGFATQYGTSSEELMKQEGSQVVVGYEWESLGQSPMFDSVELPQWGAQGAEYTAEVWDTLSGRYVSLGQYPAGVEIQFPREQLNGPRKFKVSGIDPALRICPGDRSFDWSVRFTFPAPMGLVRTPLTQDLLLLPCQMR